MKHRRSDSLFQQIGNVPICLQQHNRFAKFKSLLLLVVLDVFLLLLLIVITHMQIQPEKVILILFACSLPNPPHHHSS